MGNSSLGGLYLLYMAGAHIKEFFDKRKQGDGTEEIAEPKKQSGFWVTVIKVELTDIAFAIDSIFSCCSYRNNIASYF